MTGSCSSARTECVVECAGFKCNTAVWQALRDVTQSHGAWGPSALEGA